MTTIENQKLQIIFLPVPDRFKEKGIRAVTYARTFISIDINAKVYSFTVYKEDISKSHALYDKELDHEIDLETKNDLWLSVIGFNWLKHVYTEEEIRRSEVREGGGQVDAIIQVAKENCQEIFNDEYRVAHAAVTINEHLEILPIAGTRFKHWLRKIIKQEYHVAVRDTLLDEVAFNLISDAAFDGQTRNLSLRFASAPDDNLGLKLRWYYDLTNDEYEFIEITPDSWKVKRNEILFRRIEHQQPQDYPNNSGDYPPDIFDRFMKLLNVEQSKRLILKCYIISLFIPGLPKAILMIHGEQGSAKSMLQELIKMLVDPDILKTLSFPKDTAELVQQLSHNALVYYDNLSKIPVWISDLLCRATTGSGFSKRRVYTADDDVVYALMRNIGFNGINLAASKPDLLDRGLIFQTEMIPKGDRKRMRKIWNEFNTLKPQLLAYILDTLVKVLAWKRENPSVELLKELPRMADWAEWCEVISRCMGEEDNAFINAYTQNIELQTEEIIAGSDLASVIVAHTEDFDGTSTELLAKLNLYADSNGVDRNNRYWPKTASSLSYHLHLLQRTLRDVGIEVGEYRDTSTKNSTRKITIRITPSDAVRPSEMEKSSTK